MKTTLIVTVFNEEKTILKLLSSILSQTIFPDEVVIVDAGSRDKTVRYIRSFINKNKKLPISLFIKTGNRSIGRNEAVKKAKGDIILCTDAGCILDKNWVKELKKSFTRNVDVVAGYYKGIAENVFQMCLIPYVLIMDDRTKTDKFLPASRSMAFKKNIWEKVGGFPEKYSHNEDYVFAHSLKAARAKIIFKKSAIVTWFPRKNLKEAFSMFFRFAFGDVEAGILRTKVLFLFARYIIGFHILTVAFLFRSLPLFTALFVSFIFYLFWSIKKNYHYINNVKALFWLPALQVSSDMAVIIGSLVGGLQRLSQINFKKTVFANKSIMVLLLFYISSMFLVIKWGIPNINHPFTYQMDEWHQLQAVRAVFTQGTPNIDGAAHGPFLHFLTSGFYLVPFVLLGIINPFIINSNVSELIMQERLFIVLRLQTMMYGVLSIVILTKIIKNYIKTHPFIPVSFFVFTPIWLSLSNYYKYDIALLFWILMWILFLFRYVNNPTTRNFFFVGIVAAIACAIKISALPLFLLFVLSFFLTNKSFKKIQVLLFGSLTFLFVFILFGIPDFILGKGEYGEFFYSVLVGTPAETNNYLLESSVWNYLFFSQFVVLFGFSLSIFFLIFFCYFFYKKCKTFFLPLSKNNISMLLILFGFIIFLISLIPLQLSATGNRPLVLLPFIILIISYVLKDVLQQRNKYMYVVIGLVVFGLSIQIYESILWLSFKSVPDPRQEASLWLTQNVPEGTKIGIENIPIYQMLPDIIIKEYYAQKIDRNKFSYIIVSDGKELPSVVIVSNADIEKSYVKSSKKKLLLQSLVQNGYKEEVVFYPKYSTTSFFNRFDFFIANLVPMPSLSIFTKQNVIVKR